MTGNPAILLARRPSGAAVPEDFRRAELPLREPGPGEALVANRFLSIDPAIRGFLDDRPSYLPPVAVGEVVRGMVLGQVEKSRNPALPEGGFVRALAGWESYSLLAADALGLERFEPAPGVALASYMGALGPAGLTAWIGLNVIGAVKPGDTVLVSAAAGAVGNVVCQIAKLHGCRVSGIAGGAEKCARLTALGIDAAIDRRAVPDLAAAIRAAAPDGIDLYFDNVGGATLELVLPLMREQGRVVACGMIGDYNDQDHPHPVRTLWQLVVKRLTLRGFLTYDHGDRLAEAGAALADWVARGALRPIETIYRGLDQAPAAFIDLMAGRTMGKTLVELDPPLTPDAYS